MEEGSIVSILLLGDAEVGKSAFLARLTLGPNSPRGNRLPNLNDADQPFVVELKTRGRINRLELCDTASPTNYTLLTPNVVVLCFDVANRSSLSSVQGRWKHEVETQVNVHENLPVFLLGLKRDLRTDKRDADGRFTCVMPQEAVRVAQEMRCDRYAECSAMTGELCDLAIEDLIKMALATTKGPDGGKTEGTSCTLM